MVQFFKNITILVIVIGTIRSINPERIWDKYCVVLETGILFIKETEFTL